MMRLTPLLLLVPLVVACTKSYTCGDFPDAVCQTVAETYDQSLDGPRTGSPRPAHASRSLPPGSPPVTARAVPPDHATLDGPFLTRPRLLRIFLTPWEDTRQDLHAGGYIYLRLEESQWVIPH